METYILNGLYQRIAPVEKYESLIWTERLSAWGDFELKLHSTLENRNKFPAGTLLGIKDSYRAMTVETVEDSLDEEGRAILKLTGRSLERILDSRLARGTTDDLTTTPKWVLTGTPKVIATKIFHDICVTGILDVGDKIPLIHEGSIFPPDTIDPPVDTVTYEIDPKTVYTAIKELCDLFNMGFRLIKKQDLGELWFDIYTGSDRTTRQTTLPAVVFSSDLDNLQRTSELTTISTYKNVAYVLTPVGMKKVYGLDIDPSISGFDRQILIVKADDIKDADPVIAQAKMVRKGTEALGRARRLSAFDGELNENSQYKYGRDYNLGDLVELRNSSGATVNMQVTEQIFVSDKEGERSYPTLTIDQFIMPGTWLALPPEKNWADFNMEHWAEM